MAMYDYLCVDPECAVVTEKNVSMSERNDIQVCSDCGGPAERTYDFSNIGVAWNTTGGTRTFDSKRMPKLPDINSGHQDLTAGMLGLDNDDCAKLGI